jgi:hypothetical protein
MMPRPLVLAVLVAAVAAVPGRATAQTITQPFSGDNQRASVTQWIGPVKVTVDYSSPDVHGPGGEDRAGRIWGDLVPYGLHDLGFNDCRRCPWRAGANENTVFTVSQDVKVEGQPLAAGAYGLFMIAGPEEWTVIFSRSSTSWGAYTYDPGEDALRVTVKPATSEYREWLTYEFTDRRPDRATVALMWERLQVPIRIEVPDVHDRYVAQIRRELRDRHGFSWINWMAAAQYCLANRTHLADGLWFAEKAVGWEGVGVANFQTLTVLAQLQIASGRGAEAARTIERAMRPMDASAIQIHQFGRQLQQQGENRLALTVFETNAKRHPNAWPVNLGLARGHAALGDRAKAVAFATRALAQAPDEANRRNIEGLIQQWKQPAAR